MVVASPGVLLRPKPRPPAPQYVLPVSGGVTVSGLHTTVNIFRQEAANDHLTLNALGIVFPTKSGRFEVAVAHLATGVALLDLGLPAEAALARAPSREATAFLEQVQLGAGEHRGVDDGDRGVRRPGATVPVQVASDEPDEGAAVG